MISSNPFHSVQQTSVLQEIVQSLLHMILTEPVLLEHDELRAYPRYEVNWSAMLRYEDDPVEYRFSFAISASVASGFVTALPCRKALPRFPFSRLPIARLCNCECGCSGVDRPTAKCTLAAVSFSGVAHDVASPW